MPKQPLRIYFGEFVQDSEPYALYDPDTCDDTTFADFLTGIAKDGKLLHTRRPLDERGNITTWDEYIDLFDAAIEPAKANDLLQFTDLSGKMSRMQWASESDDRFLPTNLYTVQGNVNEWRSPTRRLSYPTPEIAYPYLKPVTIWPHPQGKCGAFSAPWPIVDEDTTSIMRVYVTVAIPGIPRTLIHAGTVPNTWVIDNEPRLIVEGGLLSPPVYGEVGNILCNVTQGWQVICTVVNDYAPADPNNVNGVNYERHLIWNTNKVIPLYLGPNCSAPGANIDFVAGDSYQITSCVWFRSYPVKMDLPFTTGTPSALIGLMVKNENPFQVFLEFWRTVLMNHPRGGRAEQDFPRKPFAGGPYTSYELSGGLDAFPGTLSPVGLGGVSGTTNVTGLFGDIINPALMEDLLDMPVLNDARARLKFDFERRSRFIDERPSQQVLVLNYETHKYYKGIVASCSPVFMEGFSRKTEDTAMFAIDVDEEGFFVEISTDGTTPEDDITNGSGVLDPGLSGGAPIIPVSPGSVPVPGIIIFPQPITDG